MTFTISEVPHNGFSWRFHMLTAGLVCPLFPFWCIYILKQISILQRTTLLGEPVCWASRLSKQSQCSTYRHPVSNIRPVRDINKTPSREMSQKRSYISTWTTYQFWSPLRRTAEAKHSFSLIDQVSTGTLFNFSPETQIRLNPSKVSYVLGTTCLCITWHNTINSKHQWQS